MSTKEYEARVVAFAVVPESEQAAVEAWDQGWDAALEAAAVSVWDLLCRDTWPEPRDVMLAIRALKRGKEVE